MKRDTGKTKVGASVIGTQVDTVIADDMIQLFDDPLGFALYAFEWGKGDLIGRELEPWQREFLIDLGKEIKQRNFTGLQSVEPVKSCVASGHGIGKSALSAILILFIMSTRPDCKGTITANTITQVKTKTWSELKKWTARCITGHWFEVTAVSMYHLQRPASWRCDIQPSNAENSESFAGQHAIDSTSFYIFDEASAIPNKVWEVAEGGLAMGEPMLFAFGNPTRNSGRFKDCFGKHRKEWIRRRIDSREVSFTNKEKIRKDIATYGKDSDFVRVRIKGIFPRMSSLQFIDNETVEKAVNRELRKSQYSHMPVILGVDVAWEGDDKHVVVKRQGLASWILGKWQHLPKETATLTQLVAKFEDEHQADAVFVDQHGVGAAVIDGLRQLGRQPIPVNFKGKVLNKDQHGSKSTELWASMRNWLFNGGSIPDDEELIEDLTGREYLPVNDGVTLLEPKRIMKKRGLDSPDCADALVCTFYAPVSKRPYYVKGAWVNTDSFMNRKGNLNQAEIEYNVLEY